MVSVFYIIVPCSNRFLDLFSAFSNASYAVSCPAGTYSVSGSSICLNCTVGYYSSVSGASTCEKCPAGSECSDPTTPQQCSSGMFAVAGQTICSACGVGVMCSVYGDSEPCPSGMYSQSGDLECNLCPAGKQWYDDLMVVEQGCALPKSPFECCSSDPSLAPQSCLPGRFSTGGVVPSCTCTFIVNIRS